MIPSLRLQVAIALAGLLIIAAILLRATSGDAAQAPARGGTYVEGLVGTPTFLNPLLAASQADRDASALVFAGLTRRTALGDLVPDLAQSWDQSADGLTYTFHLRPTARWADGEPLTSDDVLFTIGLIQDADFQGDPDLAPLWTAVQVEKIDRATVSFVLSEPYAPFLQFTTLGLLPAHLWRDTPVAQLAGAPLNTAPVGAGRWRLVGGPPDVLNAADPAQPSPTPVFTGAGLLLEPNPYYPARPLLDRLWLRSYPTAAALLAALHRGEVDGASVVDPGAVAGLLKDKALHVYSSPLQATEIIFLNLQLPMFDRTETRQALLWSLDRVALLRSAAAKQGLVADSPILFSSWTYSEVDQYTYDVGQARQLLDAAGWTVNAAGLRERGGAAFRFTLLAPDDDPVAAALAAGVAGYWRAVGVEVKVQLLPREELLNTRVVTRHFAAVLLGTRGLPYDPDQYQLWHSTQAQGGNLSNFAGLANDRIDLDLEAGRLATDPAERVRLYADFQRAFAETVPSLLLYHPLYTYVVGTRVQGIHLPESISDPSSRFVDADRWFVATRPATPTPRPTPPGPGQR